MAKLTVQYGEKANRVLEDLAKEKGVDKEDILHRALALYKYLDDEINKNRRVIVTSPDTKELLKDIKL